MIYICIYLISSIYALECCQVSLYLYNCESFFEFLAYNIKYLPCIVPNTVMTGIET